MQNEPPLCVDLDGTITLIDTLLIGCALFVRKNPCNLIKLIYWYYRHGKPYMKERLFLAILPNPQDIPYYTEFLHWLQQEKARGRYLVLATAINHRMADHAAAYLKLFDEVIASPADDNIKGTKKADVLNKRFGHAGYDYAGNSKDDLAVWPSARHAIVVNPDHQVQQHRPHNEIKYFAPHRVSCLKLLTIKSLHKE